MWPSAHAQKINTPVSMVTAAETPIFRDKKLFFLEKIAMPDNRGSIYCLVVSGGSRHSDSSVTKQEVTLLSDAK